MEMSISSHIKHTVHFMFVRYTYDLPTLLSIIFTSIF